MSEAALKRARELREQLDQFIDREGEWDTKDQADDLLAAALDAFAQEALEKVAAWMKEHSFATGHGDTLDDLLKELSWQVKERLQESCIRGEINQLIAIAGYLPAGEYEARLQDLWASLEQRTGTTKGE